MLNQTTFSAVHVAPLFPPVTSETVIGLIIPSTDTLTELEMRRMLKDDSINFSATRIKHEDVASTEDSVDSLYSHVYSIARAGELFDPPGEVNVFVYACTSGSAVISQEKLEQELHRARPGSSLTSPMTGALRAFEKLGIKRIDMLTPYVDEVGAVVVDCIEKYGFAVRASASFNLLTGPEIAAVSPESIFEAACSMVTSEADALFIPCTLLRTSSMIDRLEERLGKPVITAHQAMLWDALRLARYEKPILGHGQLLKQLT
ncbi:hypothetical protein NKH36_33050 [Mesorhizobium sp. M1312]|uniref:maleate cis-trans isomerase family protein n=1 Tax=unclassified Mesorhizobium TaxID=325217 RepID=UPI00333BE796